LPVTPAPIFFAGPAAFRRWLERHAANASELIVGFWKVGTGKPSLTWSESVDEALCFGWIDGVRRRIDDHAYQIRFTPRKPTSTWSAINIAKVKTLVAEGRMRPAGLEAFARQTDHKSSIYAYEQRATAALTDDEVRAFKRHHTAWRHFEASPPSYRKTILYWIASAKQPATRARRLAQLIDACAEGRRLR